MCLLYNITNVKQCKSFLQLRPAAMENVDEKHDKARESHCKLIPVALSG